jgi:hypothetical protein
MQRFTRRFLSALCIFRCVGQHRCAGGQSSDPARHVWCHAVSQLPAGKSALLVIDFQNEYFTGQDADPGRRRRTGQHP